MKTKHTREQWHINPNIDEAPILNEDCIDILDFETVGPTEYAANLRLIAAAPEMLETLKSIQDTFFKGGDKITTEMIHATNAAIAKAEGN
jgi:hypothetical protein